jgi:hypothetical protein
MPILAELVFVTRLLGLMNGSRDVEVQVDPRVATVEVRLDDQEVATLRGSPWKTKVDFGVELVPHELTAIARDAEGRELARDTQAINVARPLAELGALFRRHDGRLVADIRWQHLSGQAPKAMSVKLDGKTISGVVARTVNLRDVSTSELHVLDVEVEFIDGVKARKEIVFGGVTEEIPAELTPIVVHVREKGRRDAAACFRVKGQAVAASAVEDAPASVLVVRDPDPETAVWQLLMRRERSKRSLPDAAFRVPRSTTRFVWPVASGTGGADMFLTSGEFKESHGLRWLLARVVGPNGKGRRMADALAVAGSESLHAGTRRVVILLLGKESDDSRYRPATVRRYLASIGVPLRVWSLTGKRADPAWGEVEDVSSPEFLRDATDRLRRELARQRVVWLPLTPLDALRVESAPDCAWEPLARPK